MKRFIYLCLALMPLAGAQAQQATSTADNAAPAAAPANKATEDWGTPAPGTPATTPADPALTNGGTNQQLAPTDPSQAIDPNQPAAAPAGTGGLGDMLAADDKPAAEPVAMKIKPAPKLNPNSAGSYNKKAVAKQHKLSEKATEKRLRQTHRYQAVREYGQITGIRRMQKGKIPHSNNQRAR